MTGTTRSSWLKHAALPIAFLMAASAAGCDLDRASAPDPAVAGPATFSVGEHGGGVPWGVAFSSTRSGNADIFVMHAEGTDQAGTAPARNLTGANAGADQWPAWSRDGRIAFASVRPPHTNAEIYVMRADGSGAERLTTSSAANIQPAWSPDGREIAFVRGAQGSRQIWVLTLADGSLRQLTNVPDPADPTGRGDGDNYRPSWSPDGKRIVFASDRDGDFVNALAIEKSAAFGLHDIYVMDAGDGSVLARLTHNRTSLDGEPAYSPDGRQIAFRTRRFTDAAGAHYCNIAVMDADGANLRTLTPIPEEGVTAAQWCNAFPAWSRDGQEIYFHSLRPTQFSQTEILAVRVDGTGVRRLTFNVVGDLSPAVR